MLFDLSKLRGAHEHIERTLQPSVFDPQDAEYRVAAPADLSLDIRKAGADLFDVSGRVRTKLELECSRCLELFEIPVDAEFNLRYVPHAQNAGEGEREVDEDDLATAYFRDNVLDLADLLREQFVLALPMKPLHDEACRGLCPECGANLNRGDCGHSSRWEDPRLVPLKGLLNRQKEN
jgi:uncharacterized protein